MNLSNKAYRDFGLWNALELIDAEYSNVLVKAHSGDFFPEVPEDYLKVLYDVVENDFPVRADIDITNICNHKCPFCFSQYDRAMNPKLSMEPIIFYRTISELVNNGTKSIRFCGGGEPLAHPNALKLMEFTLKKPIHVTLLTNGDLFSIDFQKLFLREFVNIRFSIDSYDSKSRALTHGTKQNSFDKVIQNINLFNNQRFNLGLQESTQTGATYLLHPDNLINLLDITRQLKNIGLNYVAFRRILGKEFAASFESKVENKVKEELISIKQSLEDDSFKIFITNEALTDKGKAPINYFDKCLVSRIRVIIEANGSVQMCPRARGENSWRTLGIITSDKTFVEIWKSGVRNNQQKLAPFTCQDCIDISSNSTLVQITKYPQFKTVNLRRIKC